MPATLLLRHLWRVLPALLWILLTATAAPAQPEPIKFGQITKADLTAAPFVADSAAAAVVDLPDGSARFVYNVAATGQTVQLLSRLSLRNAVYAAGQYTGLRELYRLMLAHQSERLIIQKKPGG